MGAPPGTRPFSVSALPRLYAEVGTPLGSTLLASLTCDEASDPTASYSTTFGGLTFTLAWVGHTAGTLHVAGTPTGHSRFVRLVVTYISSDGSSTILGSSTHEITIINATDVLTIGSMAGASGNVGQPLSAILASPTTNFDVIVTVQPQTSIPGLTPALAWTRDGSGGAGTLTLEGTPTRAGTLPLVVVYKALGGITMGTSTHAIQIAPAYEAAQPDPAPDPSPPTVTPTPTRPVLDPAQQPGYALDPYWSHVKVLLHMDLLITTGPGYDPAIGPTGMNVDKMGRLFDMVYVSSVPDGGALPFGPAKDAGYYRSAAVFRSAGALDGTLVARKNSQMSAPVPGLDATDGKLTAECMVKLSSSCFDALSAPGNDYRFTPVLSYLTQAGGLVWALGYGSWIVNVSGRGAVRVVAPRACIAGANEFQSENVGVAIGLEMSGHPNRYMHLAFGRSLFGVSTALHTVWHDGVGGLYAGGVVGLDRLPIVASGIFQVGGTVPVHVWNNQNSVQVPFQGAVDEVRVTASDRYANWVSGVTPLTIPATSRVIPWPNE